MNAFWEGIVTIALMLGGVAIVSVLVSRNANTPAVIQSAASGFANNLAVAEAPVTGANAAPSLGYPSSSNLGYVFGS